MSLLDPIENELNVPKVLAEMIRDLKARVLHLETLTQNSWVKLDDVNLAASQTTIDFQSLSQNFQHLKIIGQLRTDRANTSDKLLLRFNNDSGNNYDWLWINSRHDIAGVAPVGTSNDAIVDTNINQGFVTAGTTPANIFAPIEISIPLYTATNMYKATVLFGGNITAQAREKIFSGVAHGMWRSTVAVSRITLFPLFGTNFVAGSHVTVYGLG